MARALLVVDAPLPPEAAPRDWKAPDEPKLPELTPEGYGDAGIPVLIVRRSVGLPLIEKLVKKQPVRADLTIELNAVQTEAFNVLGRVVAAPSDGKKLPGTIVIGAHYDHLGMGGRFSLSPDRHEPHVGADDNASGTAALLEIARALSQNKATLRRDVVLAAFSGEESGLLGSAHFIHLGEAKTAGALTPKDVFAMLNLDMVGRLRANRLAVFGTETAAEWTALVTPACDSARIDCAIAGDGGYGPSDHMAFYVAGIPVLHFFTGAHGDYHKPSDTPDKINAAGAAQISKLLATLAQSVATLDRPLTFRAGAEGPPPRGDLRSFNASLGTIPDYAGPGPGKSGVLLSGVRPGGAAALAGLRRGDLITKIGKHDIHSIEDLMFVLNASQPGQTTKVTIQRENKTLELDVTFQESTRPR